MTRALALAFLPLLIAPLAACDSKPADNAAAPEVMALSQEQKDLRGLNDLNRAIALKRAIHASGYMCQRIDASQFNGRYKNMDFYSARCNDSKDWALFIGGNNDVQVRRCTDTEKVGLPACKFDQAGGNGMDAKKPAEAKPTAG
ncbi:hypothetical protein ABDK56_09370 [Sphingomonas sp. ASV193]|uniref:hypothetical protein n=1 Tax=Sphingomonas sp. ASV193 TaxID=3144405 RepID=UPI0032E8D723